MPYKDPETRRQWERSPRRVQYKNAWLARRWQARRRACFERDQWICRYCGDAFSPDQISRLTVDHIVPRWMGTPRRTAAVDDLVTACLPCNQQKGRKYPYRKPLPIGGVPEWVTDPLSIISCDAE